MTWQIYKLTDISVVNPRKDLEGFSATSDVSFVPMESVDEVSGSITKPQVRKLGDVAKGYTYFKNDDVIFAKITPCMENGKCAVAENLTNGIGFGSTEFYVIRPNENILPEYIWHFLRQTYVRREAKRHFTGAAGQKRVPKSFIENLNIPIPLKDGKPDLVKQRQIVEELNTASEQISQVEIKTKQNILLAKSLFESFLHSGFSGVEVDELEFADICTVSGGFAFPHSFQGRKNEKYPFYKVSDMNTAGNETYMVHHNNSISDKDIDELRVKIYPAGTIIFPKIGAAIATNKKRILSAPSTVDNNIMVLVPKNNVSSEYLHNYILSLDLSDWASKAALPSIRKTVVEKTKILIPTKNGEPDLAVQEKMADLIKNFQQKSVLLGNLTRDQLLKLDSLRQSVLYSAFNQSELEQKKVLSPLQLTEISPIQQAIALVLRRFPRGEMVVAKVLYLGQTIFKIPLGIPFTQQAFGPYSSELKVAVKDGLSSQKQFFVRKGATGLEVLRLGSRGEFVLNNADTLLKKQMTAYLDQMMPHYFSSDSQSIELLATVSKIIEDEKTSDESVIRKKLHEWKPNKFSEAQISRTVGFIKKNNWDQKILS